MPGALLDISRAPVATRFLTQLIHARCRRAKAEATVDEFFAQHATDRETPGRTAANEPKITHNIPRTVSQPRFAHPALRPPRGGPFGMVPPDLCASRGENYSVSRAPPAFGWNTALFHRGRRGGPEKTTLGCRLQQRWVAGRPPRCTLRSRDNADQDFSATSLAT